MWKIPSFFLLLILSPSFVAADGKSKSRWSNLYLIFIYIAFFLLAAVTSYVIRGYRNGRWLGAVVEGHNSPARGMDVQVVESLPSLRFSEIKMHRVIEEGQVECAVCLAEFKDQDILRLLPDCLHAFHPDCIAPWLSSHVTCPICRTSLEHRQGSSVSVSSILERISGTYSERFDATTISGTLSSETYHQNGHGNADSNGIHRVNLEMFDGSSSSLQYSKVNLDDITRGNVRLQRSYSAGDVADTFDIDTLLPREISPKSDYRGICSRLAEELSCISPRSDGIVDYSSLILVHKNDN